MADAWIKKDEEKDEDEDEHGADCESVGVQHVPCLASRWQFK